MSFEATLRGDGRVAILDLSGDIDSRADEALDQAFAEVVEAPRVLLNFTEVGYINSTGIALIVGLLKQATENELELGAFGLSPHYEEIFEITRLTDFLDISPDEETARRGHAE
jgi:anti-sigma B factor antagonist